MQHKASWSEEKLAKELGTPLDVLRRKIGFWVKHGVLLESLSRSGAHFYVRAVQLAVRKNSDDATPIAMDEDEEDSALLSQEEQLKQASYSDIMLFWEFSAYFCNTCWFLLTECSLLDG